MEMKTIIRVFQRGEAVPKARAKRRFNQAKAFTPARTKNAEASFAELVEEAMGDREPIPKHVPLALTIIIIRPRPASAKKTQVFPISRPDTDNYVKLYLDAMNEVVYVDDSNVVRIDAWKVFGPIPGVYVEVCEVMSPPLDWEDLREIALGGRTCSSLS